MRQPSNPRKPNFLRQVLREAPVLVPAGIIFAVVQGGSLQDWLMATGGVLVVGLVLGWLIYQRELMKLKPTTRRPSARQTKRKR